MFIKNVMSKYILLIYKKGKKLEKYLKTKKKMREKLRITFDIVKFVYNKSTKKRRKNQFSMSIYQETCKLENVLQEKNNVLPDNEIAI